MQRLRINQPTQQDLDEVNDRVLTANSILAILQPPPGTIVAVSDNKNRENGIRYCEINLRDKLQHNQLAPSEWRTTGVILIEVKISQASGHQPVCQQQGAYVRKLNTKRLGSAEPLYCVLDERYIMT